MNHHHHLLATFLTLTLSANAYSEPYTPTSDDQVLQKLSRNSQTERINTGLLKQSSDNNIRYAQQMLRMAKTTGNAVFYGYTEAALHTWQAHTSPPKKVLRIRSRIHQHHHRFERALNDLGSILQSQPNDADANLSSASIHIVQGNYALARNHCNRMKSTSPAHQLCILHINSLTGNLDKSIAALSQLQPLLGPNYQPWAWSLLAEMNSRSNDHQATERAFKKSLALDPHDIPSRIAYSWWLLKQQRPADVIQLSTDFQQHDGVAVARVAALLATGDTGAAQQLSAALDKRFLLARQRGEVPHRREEGQLRLLLGDIERAHQLAKENWQTQREPLDTLLLLAAAKASQGDIQVVRTWLQTHQQQGIKDAP